MFFNVRNNKSYSRNVFTTRLKAGVDAVAVTSIGKHKLKNRLTNKLKLPQKCGRQPWVGHKATFEFLYKFL